jgi:hypothetical protein
MKEEKRIYVVIPATVQVPAPAGVGYSGKVMHVLQPMGRQIAQACHAVSMLRHENPPEKHCHEFQPITTIILQARDSRELMHNFATLVKKRLYPVLFSDENEAAYGKFNPITAMAVLAEPKQIVDILDYLPLWGS